jgi:hypothetical protein
MFDSIKDWVNIPYVIKPMISQSATGVKQFGLSVDSLCYPMSKVEVVKNDKGVEKVSHSRLYVDGPTVVSTNDAIIFEGIESPIIRIDTFYENGKPDLKVIYL